MRISDWSSDVCSSDLDQRHMLIGCRMQNDMRRTGAQQAIHSAGITYRSEKWHDVHVDLRCLSQPRELSINLIKRAFAMIDEHQTFGREGQHLPEQLAADRPSGPGYDKDLAENILFKTRAVRLHLDAPDQVFHLQIRKLEMGNGTG